MKSISLNRGPMQEELIDFSIVIPAHNEEENLLELVKDIHQVFGEQLELSSSQYEIIIVNDGSSDSTAEVVNGLELNCLAHGIHHAKNLGYGAALKSGFARSNGEYVCFIDGDRQLNPQDLCKLIHRATKLRLAIGYREKRNDPLLRVFLGWLFSRVFVPLTIGVKVRDVDCALKVIPRGLLKKIRLTADGALINSELLALAIAHDYEICEYPVSHRPRIFGEQSGAKLSVIAKVFRELLSIRRRCQIVRAELQVDAVSDELCVIQ